MVNLHLPENLKPIVEYQPSTSVKRFNLGKIVLSISLIFILAGVALSAGWYVQRYGLPYASFLSGFNKSSQSPTESMNATPSASSSARSDQEFFKLMNTQASFSNSGSLDKGKIVFVRDGNIWVINKSGQKKLTNFNSASGSVMFPVLSPDASKIVYVEDSEDSTKGSKIHIVNTDGTGDSVVTNAFMSMPVDWSADGQSLMTIRKDESDQIKASPRLVKLAGSEIRTIPGTAYQGGCGGGPFYGDNAIQNYVLGFGGYKPTVGWLDGNHYLLPGGCIASQNVLLDDKGVAIGIDKNLSQITASLDAKQFVGTSGNSVIIYSSDGTLVKKIDLAAAPLQTILTPDNKSVYFVTRQYLNQDGSANNSQNQDGLPQKTLTTLWRINSDGTGQTKVFEDDAYLIVPRKFSGDGSLLVYERIGSDYPLYQIVQKGTKSLSDLSKTAPRVDIYTLSISTSQKSKIVENGYQADYSSK